MELVLRRMLRGSVRYFAICILSGVTFTALELIIPQILRLTVDSVIGDKPVRLPGALQSLWEGLGGSGIFPRAYGGIWPRCSSAWGFCRRCSGTR